MLSYYVMPCSYNVYCIWQNIQGRKLSRFRDLLLIAIITGVVFTGNTAPFHITQPSTDNDVQIVSPTATMTTLTCSLNTTIPSTVIVFWIHNNTNFVGSSQTTTVGSTTTLLIRNPQPSDAGDYECVFNDALGSGWSLRRNIRLVIAGMLHIIQHGECLALSIPCTNTLHLNPCICISPNTYSA